MNWLRTLLVLPPSSTLDSVMECSTVSPSSSSSSPSSSSKLPTTISTDNSINNSNSRGVSSSPLQLPVCLELLLHLVCGPSVRAHSSSSGSSQSSSSLLFPCSSSLSSSTATGCLFSKSNPVNNSLSSYSAVPGLASASSFTLSSSDVFCKRFLMCVNIGYNRVLSAFRASIDFIAKVALRSLFLDQDHHCQTSLSSPSSSLRQRHYQQVPSAVPIPTDQTREVQGREFRQRGLTLLLGLIEEADIRIPNSISSRLIDWINRRVVSRKSGGASVAGAAAIGMSSSSISEDYGSLSVGSITGNKPIDRARRQALYRLISPLGHSIGDFDSANGSRSAETQFCLSDQFRKVLVNLLADENSSFSSRFRIPNCSDSGQHQEQQQKDDVGSSVNSISDVETFSPSKASVVHSLLSRIRSYLKSPSDGSTTPGYSVVGQPTGAASTSGSSSPGVEELSTSAIPWTNPGTFLMASTNFISEYDGYSNSSNNHRCRFGENEGWNNNEEQKMMNLICESQKSIVEVKIDDE